VGLLWEVDMRTRAGIALSIAAIARRHRNKPVAAKVEESAACGNQ